MFRRILIPTDGSPESERVLPLAEEIARAQGAELVLLYVADQHPRSVGRQGHMVPEREAGTHLAAIRNRLKDAGLQVRQRVERGPTVETLLDYERDEQPDLVVIATHARSGVGRVALGSVADRLVREGTVPALLVRGILPADAALSTALVLLDGSSFAEQALPMVEDMAGCPLRSLTFFRAVADPRNRREAERYLQTIAARFSHANVRTTTWVEVGEPLKAVEARANQYDVVVVSTHGRGGFNRWRHGSVADSLVHGLDRPVLLVRVKEP